MPWYMFQLRSTRYDLADKLVNFIRSLIDSGSSCRASISGSRDFTIAYNVNRNLASEVN